MKLSEHFDDTEFVCKCGCGKSIKMSTILIDCLEKLHELMGAKAIYINSGYRCENNPYGFKTDAHRKGIAADIMVQRKDDSFYTANEIAEAAERVGFGGIGLMHPDSCHVDTRNVDKYVNDWWHGDETNGIDYPYKNHTFIKGTKFDGEVKNVTRETKHKVTVIIDGKTVFESEV